MPDQVALILVAVAKVLDEFPAPGANFQGTTPKILVQIPSDKMELCIKRLREELDAVIG
jgi:hypothetical protein